MDPYHTTFKGSGICEELSWEVPVQEEVVSAGAQVF